jgi:hypothetical protein
MVETQLGSLGLKAAWEMEPVMYKLSIEAFSPTSMAIHNTYSRRESTSLEVVIPFTGSSVVILYLCRQRFSVEWFLIKGRMYCMCGRVDERAVLCRPTVRPRGNSSSTKGHL